MQYKKICIVLMYILETILFAGIDGKGSFLDLKKFIESGNQEAIEQYHNHHKILNNGCIQVCNFKTQNLHESRIILFGISRGSVALYEEFLAQGTNQKNHDPVIEDVD